MILSEFWLKYWNGAHSPFRSGEDPGTAQNARGSRKDLGQSGSVQPRQGTQTHSGLGGKVRRSVTVSGLTLWGKGQTNGAAGE